MVSVPNPPDAHRVAMRKIWCHRVRLSGTERKRAPGALVLGLKAVETDPPERGHDHLPINQKYHRQAQKLSVNIIIAVRWSQALRAYHWRIRDTEILQSCPYGLTANEVATRLGVAPSNISSRLSKLAAYGNITKRRKAELPTMRHCVRFIMRQLRHTPGQSGGCDRLGASGLDAPCSADIKPCGVTLCDIKSSWILGFC